MVLPELSRHVASYVDQPYGVDLQNLTNLVCSTIPDKRTGGSDTGGVDHRVRLRMLSEPTADLGMVCDIETGGDVERIHGGARDFALTAQLSADAALTSDDYNMVSGP